MVVGVVILSSLGLIATQASSLKVQAPEEIVISFYETYLESFNLGSEERDNPLVARTYRNSPYLHPTFVEAVDALLVSFETSDQPGGYDPFLLAQDVPQHVTVADVRTFDDISHVRVATSFEGHELLVTLTRVKGNWRIMAVNPAPETVVASFYTWYTHYEGNPLVDGTYAEYPTLTRDFVSRVDESLTAMKASKTPGGADPILLAQDVPAGIETSAGGLSATEATVELELIWSGNPKPSKRIVTLSFEDRQWKIDGVTLAK
jgi:hypothetical protein